MIKGEEVLSIEIDQLSADDVQRPGYGEITIEDSTNFSIWSEFDVEYEGNVRFQYYVAIYRSDSLIFDGRIDPMEGNLTVGETKTTVNGKTKWKFSKLNGEMYLINKGSYDVVVKLFSTADSLVTLNSANFILRI